MLRFRVAKLAKSFGRVRLAESLGDFRYIPLRKAVAHAHQRRAGLKPLLGSTETLGPSLPQTLRVRATRIGDLLFRVAAKLAGR